MARRRRATRMYYAGLEQFARDFQGDIQAYLGDILHEWHEDTHNFTGPTAKSVTPIDSTDPVDNVRLIDKWTNADGNYSLKGTKSSIGNSASHFNTIDAGRRRQQSGKLANIRTVGSTLAPRGMTKPTVARIDANLERLAKGAISKVESRVG